MATVHRRGPDLFVHNAAEVAYPERDAPGITRAPRHALYIQNRLIAWTGPEDEAPQAARSAPRFDARGGAVIPALVDCHTHTVFGGNRVEDFSRRAAGRTYAEIAAAGGGILTTVRDTRAASLDDLVERARSALIAKLHQGVATTEIKSGYGLSRTSERKMLDAIDVLRREGWDVESTLLAAHAVPPEPPRQDYLRMVCDQLIPEVAESSLARFVDVFVEKGAYTLEEGRQVFEAAKAHGLVPKVHADQLTPGGGAELAAEMNAASADHLENISDAGMAAMRTHNVVGVLLPGAMVYLGDVQPTGADRPGLGRRLVDGGVEVAVATDYNPGSSPTNNLPLMATLACTLMGLTAEESLRAVTRGAANALQRPDVGHFEVGARGRLLVLDSPDSRALVARFGEPVVRDVVLT